MHVSAPFAVTRVRALPHKSRGWQPRLWGARLFKEVSLGYSPESLSVLDEWIDSGKESKVEAAAALLREADPDFVYINRDLVVKLIQRAYVAGDECLKKVESHLFASATSGVRSGVPGEPFPEDVALRDQASSAARELLAGSPEYRYYDGLAKYAGQSIRQHLLEGEEIFE